MLDAILVASNVGLIAAFVLQGRALFLANQRLNYLEGEVSNLIHELKELSDFAHSAPQGMTAAQHIEAWRRDLSNHEPGSPKHESLLARLRAVEI